MNNRQGSRCGPLVCAIMLLALAMAGASAADAVRVGYWVLKTGDAERKVLQAMGPPDARAPLRIPGRAPSGQRWYYSLSDRETPRVVTITLRSGRIATIQEKRLPQSRHAATTTPTEASHTP
jgi:hypothetical protein